MTTRSKAHMLLAVLAVCLALPAAVGDEFLFPLSPGWNFVSSPLASYTPRGHQLGPSVGPAWIWDGNCYRAVDRVESGRGFWLFFDGITAARSTPNLLFTGWPDRCLRRYLNPGWNAVGALSSAGGPALLLPPADADGVPLDPPVWTYGESHLSTGAVTIAPGNAFWQKVSAKTQVRLSSAPEFQGAVLAYSPTPGEVVLHWPDAGDDRTTEALMSYEVYGRYGEHATDLDTPPFLLATEMGQNTTTLPGLVQGETYEFLIVAVDEAGNRTKQGHAPLKVTVAADQLTVNGPVKDLNALGIAVISVAPDGLSIEVDPADGLLEGDIILFNNPNGPDLMRIVSIVGARAGIQINLQAVGLDEVITGGQLHSSVLAADMRPLRGQEDGPGLRFTQPGGAFDFYTAPGIPVSTDWDPSAPCKGTTGTWLEDDSLATAFHLDSEPTVRTEVDFETVPQPSLALTIEGELNFLAAVDLQSEDAQQWTVDRLLQTRTHTWDYTVNGLPVRQQVTVAFILEGAVETSAAMTAVLALEAKDAIEHTLIFDGVDWSSDGGGTSTASFELDVSAPADVTADLAIRVSATCSFYSRPVAVLDHVVSATLATAEAAPPSEDALHILDVGHRISGEIISADGAILGAGTGGEWSAPPALLLDKALLSLPTVEFADAPPAIPQNVAALFSLDITGDFVDQFQPISYEWSAEPVAGSRAIPVIEPAPNGRSATVRIVDTGTFRLLCTISGTVDGNPAAISGITEFVVSPIERVFFDPAFAALSPGDSAELSLLVELDSGDIYTPADGGTRTAEPSGRLALDGVNVSAPAGTPPGVVLISSAIGGESAYAAIRVDESEAPADRFLVIDISGGTAAQSYPTAFLSQMPAPLPDEFKTTKILLRRIPSGVYRMGSPTDELGRFSDESLHTVSLTRDFYIGVFEITQHQWELVTGTPVGEFFGDMRPAEQVSYTDIRGGAAGMQWPDSGAVDSTSFIGILRTKTGLATLDLPTESQWEYACRTGVPESLYSGQNISSTQDAPELDPLGRYWYNGGEDYTMDPVNGAYADVGSYIPNAWGLFDMHGNVAEWCLDWYGSYPGGAVVDPMGPTDGTSRVIRGGSWFDNAGSCRSAARWFDTETARFNTTGLRIAYPAP